MAGLGPLAEIEFKLASAGMPSDIRDPLRRLLYSMAEIDGDITKSRYGHGAGDEKDRVPDGDDYNLLWDAILDALGSVAESKSESELIARIKGALGTGESGEALIARNAHRAEMAAASPISQLMFSLSAYVSRDDVELDHETFLRFVADRINDDLARAK